MVDLKDIFESQEQLNEQLGGGLIGRGLKKLGSFMTGYSVDKMKKDAARYDKPVKDLTEFFRKLKIELNTIKSGGDAEDAGNYGSAFVGLNLVDEMNKLIKMWNQLSLLIDELEKLATQQPKKPKASKSIVGKTKRRI
jgi:cell fate (sporulation/competence/biofilm development) regulator YlbF (YheA/YmcA/DUF963 family)